jgi:TetR/AcrR family transcriptional repressor of nem operon
MSQLNTTDTKGRLLETAMDLILAESYGSVSVDAICEKAKVKKGSFYYFFPSKADLVVAAFESHWETKQRPVLDKIFSAQESPLKRLIDFFEYAYNLQKNASERIGKACGCPYSSVGMEQGTLEQKLRQDMEYHLDQHKKYLESAIRDAVRVKEIPECNVQQKTDEIFAYYLGGMMQSKIANSLEPVTLKKVKPALFQLLGINAAKGEK